MSESTPPTDPHVTDPTTPAPKKKRRRKWPWVILGLLAIIVLLVLLAPAILSTGAGKNLVVAQINKNLNGRVEINDWSIGWTSGVRVDGVRVFDASNAQIAQLKTASTELSLLDAAKGKIALGKTVVDGLNFNAKVDKDGQLNFAKLVKQDPAQPAGPAQPSDQPAPPGEPSKLPEVSGDITLSNITGTIEQPGQPALHITDMAGGAKIDSLNDPIEHHLDVALRVADKPAGKIGLKGTASAKDGDLNNLAVSDTLTLADIDSTALRPLIPADLGIIPAGVTNGVVTLVVAEGKSATLSGELNGSGYQVTGDALNGDTFVTKDLKITIPSTVITMPNGPTDTAAMAIKTGGEQLQPITITWDQGKVTASVDAALLALQNLAANKAPGSSGKVRIDTEIDLAALANQMPNTLSIPKDVKLQSGKQVQVVELLIHPDHSNFTVTADVTGIAGTNAGKPVKIQDIHVGLTGEARGSDQKLPDLRNLSLGLTSGFAKADFKAPTLTQLAGQASADLKKMEQELGQIVDFQGKSFAGTFVMNVSAKGDPQKLSTPAPAHVDATLSNVVIAGVADQPITVEKLVANIDAVLNATDDGTLQSVNNTVVAVENFKGADKTLDAKIDQIAVKLGETLTASWNLDYLKADMARLQDELKPFVKQLQGERIDVGMVTVKLSGDMTQAGQTMTANIRGLSVTESKNLFSVTQAPESVLKVKMVTPETGDAVLDASAALAVKADLSRLQDSARPFVPALKDAGRLDVGMLDVDVAADLSQAGQMLSANVSRLSITESKNLFSLSQPKDRTLTVKMVTPENGQAVLEANGRVELAADLKRAQALARQFQTEVAVNGKQPQVTDGKLGGWVELATLDAKSLKLTGDLKIDSLAIDTGQGTTARQNITLALASTATTDFTSVRETSVKLGGAFGEVNLDNVAVDLPQQPADAKDGVALPLIKNAKLTVNITDFGAIDSLRSAFAPAPPPPATQPVRIPSGSMKLAADVKQQGNDILVNVTELTGANDGKFVLQQGDGAYTVKPFNGKLAIKVALTGDARQPLDQQIKQIAVTEMDVKSGVADITMPKPITIDRPLSDTPAPTGSIKVAGKLQDVTAIPEALASKKSGELYPYQGDFVLVQDISMADGAIVPKGTIEVTNFVALKDGQPLVTEPKVTIANNLSANLNTKVLKINQLVIDMPQSGALNVNITGGVTDWESKRQLDNILIKLAGDWEKLWTIVKPMVPADSQEMVKDLQLAGKFDRQITVSGSMPAGVEGPESTRNLKAAGSIEVPRVVWPSYGITEATDVGTAFKMEGNFIRTSVPDEKAYKPITVNGGRVEIRDMEIDLNDSVAPRLNMPPEYQMVKGVSLTSAMTEKLGELFKNPLFVASKESSGTLDLRINECKRLPLSDIMMKQVPENDGLLRVTYSINDFRTLNEFTTLVGMAIDDGDTSTGSDLRGSIKDATATIANGKVQQDTTLLFGQRNNPLRLVGGVDMSTTMLQNFKVNLPPALMKEIDKKLSKYLPAGVDIALRGPAAKPQWDPKASIGPMLQDAAKKALADQLLGGGKSDDTKPGEKPKDDPLGGALDDLFGGKKKKK